MPFVQQTGTIHGFLQAQNILIWAKTFHRKIHHAASTFVNAVKVSITRSKDAKGSEKFEGLHLGLSEYRGDTFLN